MKPGTYSFDYFIKPLLGEFQNLASLQVIALPAEGDSGHVPLDQVSGINIRTLQWERVPSRSISQVLTSLGLVRLKEQL